MAYDYRILPEQDLLIITGSGTVTSDDIRRVVTGFQKDAEWRPNMKMLVDWRRIDDLMIELEDVHQLATEALGPDMLELGTPLGPSAAVVLADHKHASVPMLYYGYLRKSQLKSKIFFRMEDAAKWLDIDVKALPPENLPDS